MIILMDYRSRLPSPQKSDGQSTFIQDVGARPPLLDLSQQMTRICDGTLYRFNYLLHCESENLRRKSGNLCSCFSFDDDLRHNCFVKQHNVTTQDFSLVQQLLIAM
jgi:hypothetical protein